MAAVVRYNGIGDLTLSAHNYVHTFFPRGVTWLGAELDCVLRGGHLPSVHSQAEYDLVKAAVWGDWGFWIGGNDRAQEGLWTWTDGSPWTWASWATADMPPQLEQMPRNGTGEDCAIQRTSHYPPAGVEHWIDAGCAGQVTYVCYIPSNLDGRNFPLEQLIRLVHQARAAGVTLEQIWSKVEQIKITYMSREVRTASGINIAMSEMVIKPGQDRCSGGSLEPSHTGILVNTLVEGFPFFKNQEDKVSPEDIKSGFNLFTYVSLCPLDTLDVLNFFKALMRTESPKTIIQTMMNSLKPGSLPDKVYTRLTAKLYTRLDRDKVINLSLGKQVNTNLCKKN